MAAQAAKEKGNIAFKASDFPIAVEHYSEAIRLNPKDPTFFLNRSAAYLKLGKNEDAERDCNAVLRLNSRNVKGFYRRAQARIALGGIENIAKAEHDLKEALTIDPSNEALKQELARIPRTTRGSETSEALHPDQRRVIIKTVDSSDPDRRGLPNLNRRRVPITIVDPAETFNISTAPVPSLPLPSWATRSPPDGLLNPVSTRPLSCTPSSSTSTPTPVSFSSSIRQTDGTSFASTSTPSSQPNHGVATQSPQVKPTRKVGGGIFRHSGSKNPPPVAKSDGQPRTAVSSSSRFSSQSAVPSLIDFAKSWNELFNPRDRWEFIQRSVPPSSLPTLFKSSLDSKMLISILETFLAILSEDTPSKPYIQAYLSAFPQVERFGLVVMFMNNDEKEIVKVALKATDTPSALWKM